MSPIRFGVQLTNCLRKPLLMNPALSMQDASLPPSSDAADAVSHDPSHSGRLPSCFHSGRFIHARKPRVCHFRQGHPEYSAPGTLPRASCTEYPAGYTSHGIRGCIAGGVLEMHRPFIFFHTPAKMRHRHKNLPLRQCVGHMQSCQSQLAPAPTNSTACPFRIIAPVKLWFSEVYNEQI